jgi:hypothetical protein
MYNDQSEYLPYDESELIANYQNENVNISNFSANSMPKYRPFSKRYSDRANNIMHSNTGSNASSSYNSSMKKINNSRMKLPPKPVKTNSFKSPSSNPSE